MSRDETERPIEDVVTPLTDDTGGTAGTVVAFRDVTDRIRAQQEQERASRLSSLGVLAGGIAHDFNNILAAIMGNVSLVRVRLSGNDEADATLEQAEQACIRARQLTQQLLTFARGGAPLKKPLALEPLLQESAKLALSGSNVRMAAEIDPMLWALDADEGQLVQAFHNLLLNAGQAMPGGGTVEVCAENLAEHEARSHRGVVVKAGPYVQVSITDHGAGIADDVLERVFEPVLHDQNKRQRPRPGNGVFYRRESRRIDRVRVRGRARHDRSRSAARAVVRECRGNFNEQSAGSRGKGPRAGPRRRRRGSRGALAHDERARLRMYCRRHGRRRDRRIPQRPRTGHAVRHGRSGSPLPGAWAARKCCAN